MGLDMNLYVIWEPGNGYLKQVCGKGVPNWRDAKHYKRLKAAINPFTGAGLMNTQRTANIVEVHEYDQNGQFVRAHAAPPVYIYL